MATATPAEPLEAVAAVVTLPVLVMRNVYVTLPPAALACRDLSLQDALDADGHYIEKKERTLLDAGETLYRFGDPCDHLNALAEGDGFLADSDGDGINDIFHIYSGGNAIEKINVFRIYSRWGESIFESCFNRLADPLIGI